jgi:uncharacterized protein DUF5681
MVSYNQGLSAIQLTPFRPRPSGPSLQAQAHQAQAQPTIRGSTMTYDPACHNPDCDPASDGRFYDVGYGKPPHHTRFQKGQSGNPGGRPRGAGTRVKQLALDEAYREVAIDEDGEAIRMPAIQAVIRAQLALAAKGNGPAQRAVLKMVQAIETERAAIEAEEAGRLAEAARRIAYLRRLAEEEERYEKQTQAAEAGARAADASGAQANDGTTASAPTAGPSDGAANSVTHIGRADEAILPDTAVCVAASPSPRLPSGRLRPSSTGYGEGRGEGACRESGASGESPSSQPSPRKDGEKEKPLAPAAATGPQGKDETSLGPQAGSPQHGRRNPQPQTQRRDTAYDRLPLPERTGVEDGRRRPEGGPGRSARSGQPAADEAPSRAARPSAITRAQATRSASRSGGASRRDDRYFQIPCSFPCSLGKAPTVSRQGCP